MPLRVACHAVEFLAVNVEPVHALAKRQDQIIIGAYTSLRGAPNAAAVSNEPVLQRSCYFCRRALRIVHGILQQPIPGGHVPGSHEASAK